MAARRPRRSSPARAEAGGSPPRPTRRRASICVPAFAGLGAPYWSSERAAPSSALDARNVARGHRKGCAGERRLPDARPDRGDERRRRRQRDRASCASTAAWRRATGRCSSSPTWLDVAGRAAARCSRSTALGAAFAAGWQAGVYPGPEFFAERRCPDRVFTPAMDAAACEALYRGWRAAVERAL